MFTIAIFTEVAMSLPVYQNNSSTFLHVKNILVYGDITSQILQIFEGKIDIEQL